MIALIDGDNVAYACAAGAEDQSENIAVARMDMMLDGIREDTKADELEVWLSGPTNFRTEIYPEYKAQRKDKLRPIHEQACRAWMKSNWQAKVSEHCEADDMLGVRQMELNNTIICHLDKDMNMIPGWHFNWELRRLGEVVREKQTYFITREEADRYFYYQLLIGDPVDNIKGARGIGDKKATAFLDSTPREEWYQSIGDFFSCDEELEMNANCIYIWRKLKDNWRNIATTIS